MNGVQPVVRSNSRHSQYLILYTTAGVSLGSSLSLTLILLVVVVKWYFTTLKITLRLSKRHCQQQQFFTGLH